MHIKPALFLLLFCLIFSAMILPAQAATINDAGAKRLKNTLSAYLKEQEDIIAAKGGTLRADGEITIEQGSAYYAATLPALTIENSHGIFIKLGLTAINAIPTDNENDWKMSLSIPTPILLVQKNTTGKEDKVIAHLNIGEQNMGGIWSSSLNNFSKLSAKYRDIDFIPANEKENHIIFKIGNIAINSDMKENKKDLWSGPSNAKISNISITPTTKNGSITIQSISMNADVKNFNYNAYKKYKSTLIGKAPKDHEHFNNALLNFIKSSGDGSVKMTISNINSDDPTAKKNTFKSLNNLQISGTSNFKKENLNQTFDISFNGLKLNAADASLIPEQFKTSISLDKLPLETILKTASGLGKDLIESKKENKPTENLEAQLKKNILQSLKNANTSLSLSNTKIGNNDYNIMLDGKIIADPTSKTGGVGMLNITTTGLDHVMNQLQKSPETAQMAAPLTMFRMISNQEGNKNTAKIVLNPQGNISVNGKDLSALMGGTPAQ